MFMDNTDIKNEVIRLRSLYNYNGKVLSLQDTAKCIVEQNKNGCYYDEDQIRLDIKHASGLHEWDATHVLNLDKHNKLIKAIKQILKNDSKCISLDEHELYYKIDDDRVNVNMLADRIYEIFDDVESGFELFHLDKEVDEYCHQLTLRRTEYEAEYKKMKLYERLFEVYSHKYSQENKKEVLEHIEYELRSCQDNVLQEEMDNYKRIN